ncbi:MAG: HAMP domain-containing protein [Propionibacteriales bacterium]|nr:HAMP domain-containing protein [Propionibacteriales bacterium]
MRLIPDRVRGRLERARVGFEVVRSVLRGDPENIPGPKIRLATEWLVGGGSVVASLAGAAVAVLLLLLVLPYPPGIGAADLLRPANSVTMVVYAFAAGCVGVVRGRSLAERPLRFLAEERAPSEHERVLTLRLPLRLMVMQLILWVGGAALMFGINVSVSLIFAVQIAATIALCGLTTAAISYLHALRIGRAAAVRVLADTAPRHYGVPGIAVQMLFIWALGTTVPVVGMVLLTALTLDRVEGAELPATEITRSVLVLSITAIVVGFGTMLVFARWVAAPLERLRDALQTVEGGDFTTSVSVSSANEVGFAQAGFNRMVAGLREREELRDLFGRHVGEEVARRALEEGVRLGGEVRVAAALFVDLVGSTTIAARRGPSETVSILNAFFAIVVDETQRRGGLVNKFAGDAALCVFGIPLPQPDPAGAALATGRAMQARLIRELPGVPAGIGLSAGEVVAGNVGAAHRFEYTVIGDPVNEASRLTEIAKERPGRVVASAAIVSRAAADEAAHWEHVEPVLLRGRSELTRLAVPIEPPA